MIGYADGTIKILAFRKGFEPELAYKFELKTGEELTVCTMCPNDINFAVGTTFGEVFLCSIKKDPTFNIMAVRLSGVTRQNDKFTPVTGILLSSFDPEGSMVVAFSNGEVRTWQS